MKKLLIITLSIITIASGLGVGAYYYFMVPDQNINEQLDITFGPDFFETFDLELEMAKPPEETTSPPKTSTPTDQAEEITEPPKNESPDQESQPESFNHNDEEADSDPQDNSEDAIVTTDDIVERYEPKIRSLEAIALDKLNTLYKSAIEDYLAQRKEGKVNRTELARKYLQAAVRLENNVDSKFYEILDELEMELKKHQLPTSIISSIKKEYNNKKSEMRREYLSSYLPS